MTFMFLRRVGVYCLLIVMISSFTPRTASSQSGPAALKDVWFTKTQAPKGQNFGYREPEQIWDKTGVFVQGKDPKVSILILFNNQGSHSVRGVRKDAQGGEYGFQFTTAQRSAVGGWRSATWDWETDRLKVGKHTVDLIVDDMPAGSYAFEVK